MLAEAYFYNEHGYLLLENHLHTSVIEALRSQIARIEQTAYGMTKFNDIEEYNEWIMCGVPTIAPRVSETPVRTPQPQPAKKGSIYEIQSS